MKSWQKLLGWFWVVFGILLLIVLLLALPSPTATKQVYGVTFSAPHAEGIGLDWKETYDAILDDLGVKRLRLSAYWNVIEPEDGVYDWGGLDYQMDRAAEVDAEVLLSIGRKLPRWPECHIPEWAEALPREQQRERVLVMLEEVVTRYQEHPALVMWQLENEPLLEFGECTLEDPDFLHKEESLVRQFDEQDHPIMITDSGELNSWLFASAHGDLLGTTMYRTVFSSKTEKLFHYDYIFPSWMYRLKSRYVKILRGKDVQISELQGEPWAVRPWPEATVAERRDAFSLDRFAELQQFAARTQLPVAYWWGAEYWYWEKEVHGEDAFWEQARNYFKGGE